MDQKRLSKLSDKKIINNLFTCKIYDILEILSESEQWIRTISIVDWKFGLRFDMRAWSADYKNIGKGISITFSQAEELLKPSFDYISLIRNDVEFMRYHFTDAYVREKEEKEKKEEKPKKNQTYYKEMEIALSESLERKVKVTYGNGKGKLVIDFFDKEDLKTIAEMLTKE